jgi:hypothetical protein
MRRGVYEVDPRGPAGEQLVLAVDSRGALRRHRLAAPEEREVVIAMLWRFLDSVDPAAAGGRRLRVLR